MFLEVFSLRGIIFLPSQPSFQFLLSPVEALQPQGIVNLSGDPGTSLISSYSDYRLAGLLSPTPEGRLIYLCFPRSSSGMCTEHWAGKIFRPQG